ncbi:hypothetical protein GOP47_0021345 [Adiantum capillus-veneris]|uniref:Uncharacterized protein n=1 Tax=Adiantum capillus-veneris TaxID=13818 RepID=A0A9D4Z547_ADICA|nr:hypothetical protein GOP47_0021345 [Adiantum capillus-veneris]
MFYADEVEETEQHSQPQPPMEEGPAQAKPAKPQPPTEHILAQVEPVEPRDEPTTSGLAKDKGKAIDTDMQDVVIPVKMSYIHSPSSRLPALLRSSKKL